MIPKKVIVGPFTFAIEMDETAKITLTDAHGETDIERLVIRLHPDRHPQIIKETFLHEVLHACASVAGLDHELGLIDRELEEKVVRRIAPVLLDVILRNKGVVTYLCGTNAAAEITPKATKPRPNPARAKSKAKRRSAT